ncbi:hypothetical protein L1987_39547 [Smallanthus sonchifolius]|uniref:Uncharacterized protein n=1 Tax=Smallanthus sonchifolius TaxID=185202 RepID=A0ACB9HNH8_9ASTR|nr:hypothetical protein L1987_39547 [Smallanthus sonchifolius]
MAHAYHLRGKGQTSQLEREKCLKEAAELFSSIGKKVLAAECFYEIADYRTAVEEYEKAGDFAKCLSACTDGKLFEIGFKLLGRYGD